MPVRRGHVVPHNTFIDSIIRKFDGMNRRFLVANALVDSLPIIYCNDGFCELVGWTRAELMQRSCVCDFLHGPLTDPDAVVAFKDALTNMVERQTELLYYRKDGTKFLCSQVVAPIRNEDGDICMFIVNFEDVTDAPYKADEEAASTVPPLPRPAATVRPCRSRSLRLRLPGSRKTSFALSSPPPVPEDAAEDTAETVALQAMVIDQSCPQDRLLPRTDRAPPPPARAATAIFAASPYCRESIQRAANSVGRVMPNASSESDLGRYLTGGPLGSTPPVRGKSPSLSQVTTDPRKDNSHSSTASKLVLKEVQSHGFKQHVGEKVAQVSFLHHLRLFFSSFLFRAVRSPTQKWRHVKDAFASFRT